MLRHIVKGGKVAEGRIDALLSETQLSSTKLLTLRHLVQTEEPISLGALAQCMAFAKSNATQVIDHLESAGLVRRVPSPDDRRCTRVSVTNRGKQQEAAGSRALRPLAEQIESLFTAQERSRFYEYLARVSDALS